MQHEAPAASLGGSVGRCTVYIALSTVIVEIRTDYTIKCYIICYNILYYIIIYYIYIYIYIYFFIYLFIYI